MVNAQRLRFCARGMPALNHQHQQSQHGENFARKINEQREFATRKTWVESVAASSGECCAGTYFGFSFMQVMAKQHTAVGLTHWINTSHKYLAVRRTELGGRKLGA